MVRLMTVGHGTLDPHAFAELIRGGGIGSIVDVRTFPGSRRFPWFGRDQMERWLPEAGIAYRWEKDLGGFRKAAESSPHTALRVEGFRGYADHMETPAFRGALERVLTRAQTEPTAVMCSEGLWWRCHRRMLSDAASILHGAEVVHLMPGGRTAPHRPTEGVRRDGDLLVYDAGQGRLA